MKKAIVLFFIFSFCFFGRAPSVSADALPYEAEVVFQNPESLEGKEPATFKEFAARAYSYFREKRADAVARSYTALSRLDDRLLERLSGDTLGAHSYTAYYNECRAAGNGVTICTMKALQHAAVWTNCHDGEDNDNDGSVDYPADANCTSIYDTTEGSSGFREVGEGETEEEATQALPPSVSLTIGGSGGPVYVNGDAYETKPEIKVQFSDGNIDTCTTGVSSGGFLSSGGSVSAPYTGTKWRGVTVSASYSQTFSISCSGPGGTGSDAIVVRPQWDPRLLFWANDSDITKDDTVYLKWKGEDLKSCKATKGWIFPTNSTELDTILRHGNPQGGTHTMGKIAADRTYNLICTGFDNSEITKTVFVNFHASPAIFFPPPPPPPAPPVSPPPPALPPPAAPPTPPEPYFFINNINLIIIGPGSGGRSNKATIGVTSGGGFTGELDLSATSAELDALPGGDEIQLKLAPESISCQSVGLSVVCSTAEFWVDTASDIPEGVYDIIVTADPVPSGFESTTQTIPLRVRQFIPAYEEI